MLKTRVIPCLLLRNKGLVKTVKFKNPKYVGDPINAVKIFNDKEVDELIFLDITASQEGRRPDLKLLSEIASECFMPLAYGGGITTAEEIREILQLGVEKVSLNSAAISNPALVRQAAELFGSQSIVVTLDVKKTLFGRSEVMTHSGSRSTKRDPIQVAQEMERSGAGELLINSIDRDGTYSGYDLLLVKSVAEAVKIPVIALGGASKIEDLGAAVKQGRASAVAAGSLFVFHGPHRAVLINFPTRADLDRVFSYV